MLLTTKAWHGTTVVYASSLLSVHRSHRELLLHIQCKGKSKFRYGTGNSLPRTARVRQWWDGREEEAVRMAIMMVKSRRQAYHAWGPPSGLNGDCLVSLSCQSQIQEALLRWTPITKLVLGVPPLWSHACCLSCSEIPLWPNLISHFNIYYTVLDSEGKVYTLRES